MSINQNQIRDISISTVAAAALVGRPNEISHIVSLSGIFKYTINALLVDDGSTIIPALGANSHWQLVANYSADIKSNYVAIVAPTATDDTAAGYAIGSHWVDTVGKDLYIASDVTATAAVWVLVSNNALDNFIAIIAPTATDDSAAGYSVGSTWIDVTANKSYVCVDATATAAIWNQIDTATIVDNLVAIIAPTATDDSAAGYAIGSHWFDTVGKDLYIASDVTATAAVWVLVSNNALDNFAAIVAPTATDDTAAGYSVGSTWIDVTADKSYICVDATATAAIWNQISSLLDNFVAISPPGSLNDSTMGYSVGSTWIDVTNDNSYMCVDSTINQAVWHQIDIPVAVSLTQVAHGFTVGTPISFTAGAAVGAIATTSGPNAQAVVTKVVDVNNFEYMTEGRIIATAHGFTVDNYYWSDQATVGAVTLTKPALGVAQSVFYVLDVNTLLIDIGFPENIVNTPLYAKSVQMANAGVSVIELDGYEFRLTSGGNRHFEWRQSGTAVTLAANSTVTTLTSSLTTSTIKTGTLSTTFVPVWTDTTNNFTQSGSKEEMYWSDGTNQYSFIGIVGNAYNNNTFIFEKLV